MNHLKNAIKEGLGVALWVGISAMLTYLLTAMLDKPELAPYYGIINIILYALKSLKK